MNKHRYARVVFPSIAAFLLALTVAGLPAMADPPGGAEVQREVEQAVRNFWASEEGEECREEVPMDPEEVRECNEEIRECIIEHLKENSHGFNLPDFIIIVAKSVPVSSDVDDIADVRNQDVAYEYRNLEEHEWDEEPVEWLWYLPISNTVTRDSALTTMTPAISGASSPSYAIFPALPSGLSIHPTSGVISGTPTVISGATTYTVTATHSGGAITSTVSITVNDIPPSNLSYTPPSRYGSVNTWFGFMTPMVSGGPVVSYTIAPALPSGLSINPTSGAISGTPTVTSPQTTYTITATNSGGSTTANVVIAIGS